MKQIDNTDLLKMGVVGLMEHAIDITGAERVEIMEGPTAGRPGTKTLWVNVDGVCMLRINLAKKIDMPNVYGTLSPVIGKLKEMRQGTFDINPTRYLPTPSNSAAVDEWWLNYFKRSQDWQRMQAQAMLDLLSLITPVETN